jgi:hypothetical protein
MDGEKDVSGRRGRRFVREPAFFDGVVEARDATRVERIGEIAQRLARQRITDAMNDN